MTKRAAHAWLRPTTRTERALQDAQEHARQSGVSLARSGHLLLALVQEPLSLSTRVLVRLGVSAAQVQAETARLQAEAASVPVLCEPPKYKVSSHTAEAEPTEFAWADNRAHVLDAARIEAQSLGDSYVGTEHLLLALLHGSGVTSRLLNSLNVTYDCARAALLEMREEGLV